MRAGLSTIQQTLTPEAASVLNHSIAEAGRRNHGQTTPLHVAATLLASPSGYLRQACIRSHPNSSHPLQCRALELCFSVALERLPTAQNMSPGAEPPVSNALMAALKRAQAHQRRGCPEQQQQPLLAVKVELEQLIISILDDPSVSRVMREASFSSPAVKATIEQSLNPSPPGSQRDDQVKKVFDIIMSTSLRRSNPVLVGDHSEPEVLIREVLRRIETGKLNEGGLNNVKVIHIHKDLPSDKAQLPAKLAELEGVIETHVGGDTSNNQIVVDMGDLKWLVEQPGNGGVAAGQQQQEVVSHHGRAAVAEMAKLIRRFGDGKLWLIGTATCETYLRCQVYHPSMEIDWNLQAVPIASRTILPRLGSNGILSTSVESLNPLKSFATPTAPTPRRLLENIDPSQKVMFCPQCNEGYQKDLAKLVAQEFEKSTSQAEPHAPRPGLPQWLQNAKTLGGDIQTINQQPQPRNNQLEFRQKSEELKKKWNDTCLRLHTSHHGSLVPERITPTPLSLTGLGLYNPKLLANQPVQAKTQLTNFENPLQSNLHHIASESTQLKLQQARGLGESLQLNLNHVNSQPSHHSISPPRSPVRTDLVLGSNKVVETSPQKINNEPVKDLLRCLSSEPQAKYNQLLNNKFANASDTDSFKKLLKGLMEKAWWQPEAASAVATSVTQCKLGHGTQRGAGSKGSIWLLFTGPDRVAKKKMADVLSEHVCGTSPVRICLGSRREDEEFDVGIRGKTALDRIAEAVRRSPFSIIMLEDIDKADMMVRGSIKRAMERGRLTNSHGREISLGNVIFILTGNWSTGNLKNMENGCLLEENKIVSPASHAWQLRLNMVERSVKRPASWFHDKDRHTRARKDTGSSLCLDLNQVADGEDDGSNNSSVLTNDQETELNLDNGQFAVTSVPHELVSSVDAAIAFKPANVEHIQCEIEKTITETFKNVLDETLSFEIQQEALQKILSGLWYGRTSLQEWAEKVLVPAFHRLKSHYSFNELPMVARLEADEMSSGRESDGEWLPNKILLMVNGVTE